MEKKSWELIKARKMNNTSEDTELKEAVEKGAALIENFTNGYLNCIEELHEWNNGMDNPCHLDLYNRLITMEKKMKEKKQTLLS